MDPLVVSESSRLRTTTSITNRASLLARTSSEMDRDEAEKQDSRMRKDFDQVMCEQMGIPDRYQNVAVLIIRWAKHLDEDLRCWEEVDELDALLRNDFGYDSKVVVLDNEENKLPKRPQMQLNSAIANFVEKHDGHHRSTLLIVYYTGHGFLEPIKGSDAAQLIISGKQSPLGPSKTHNQQLPPPEAKWHRVEDSLHDAQPDVLVILDCCFASAVMKCIAENTRSFEILAASGKDGLTPKPGPRSYTRALINSLKEELADQRNRPFTTHDLNQKILEKKDWVAGPTLINRMEGSATRHICLAPLVKQEPTAPPPAQSAGYLTLRLAFADKATLETQQVEKLATHIAEAVKKSDLGISTVDWMGFARPKHPRHFRYIVWATLVIQRFWKNVVIRRRANRALNALKRTRSLDGPEGARTPKRPHFSLGEALEHVKSPRPCSAPPTPASMN